VIIASRTVPAIKNRVAESVIPKIIIEKLFILQDQKKCTIFVLKRYLYGYLQNIGIKCKYVEKNYTLEKSTENSSDKKEILNKEEVYSFLNELNIIYGYDYTDYQIDSIMRRINIAMIKEGICDFGLFREQVLRNENLFYSLFLDFSINTTEFFRDPKVFALIKTKILPYLNSYNHIKIHNGKKFPGCKHSIYSILLIHVIEEEKQLQSLDKDYNYEMQREKFCSIF
jgi:chemotaxis protein methyltransferase CheR